MKKPRLWFDIVNSPHVLILHPIMQEMKRRGLDVIVTGREFSQTVRLLEQKNIQYTLIGHHGGKSRAGKALSLLSRVLKLLRFSAGQKIDLTFCHGSRELIIASKLRGIPNVAMFDYEYTEHHIKNWGSTLMMAPAVIPVERFVKLGYRMEKLYCYLGLKEQIYLQSYEYEPAFVEQLGADPRKVIVVVRPPGTVGHYHDRRSEELMAPLLKYCDRREVSVILSPRYAEQLPELEQAAACMTNPPVLLRTTIDMPRLLAQADAVISGGGTMTREAAVLGTPAYSIFSGPHGGVDEYLQADGRLTWIESLVDIQKLILVKKEYVAAHGQNAELLKSIVDKALSILS